VAELSRRFTTVEQILSEADAAMYEAKRHGRNQIWVAGS
jgi:PleD family two-component response regulator